MRGTRKVGEAGYTLLELMIALIVVTIAVGAISTSMASTSSLSRATEERSIALDAALSVMEAMRATDPQEVYLRYNQTTLDDPGTGASPGRYFAVPGLALRPGDPDGFVGEVVFPGDGVQLLERVNDVQLGIELGMPRDLNADGVVDPAATLLDHSLDYTILPARVRIEWQGQGGFQRIEMFTQVGVL